jgi:argininosuccinate lyase
MLMVVAHAVPRLGVDRARCATALDGGALATDEVMRRVEAGRPFRTAYREVAAALRQGERFARPTPAQLVARRASTGGLGNLGLDLARARVRRARAWQRRERRRFDRAMSRLAGRSPRPPVRPTA